MHSVEEIPGKKGQHNDRYYSSLYAFGPLSAHMVPPAATVTTEHKHGGKRKRVNYNVKQIQQQQFMRNENSDEEEEEEHIMNVLEARKANKRFDELNRENYNDSVKIEVPKSITGLHSQRHSKPGVTVKRILNSKKTWSNYQDEISKKQLRQMRRLEVPPNVERTKKLCTICGNISNTSCIKCGARVCSVKCTTVHKETRCTQF